MKVVHFKRRRIWVFFVVLLEAKRKDLFNRPIQPFAGQLEFDLERIGYTFVILHNS